MTGQPRANGSHHRLLHQKDFARPGANGRIPHSALFHLGDFRGDADDDPRVNEHGTVVSLLDKVV